MFRRVLQSLTRSLQSATRAQAPDAKRPVSSGSVLEKVAKVERGGVQKATAPAAKGPAGLGGNATAETLCGITPQMSREEVAARLKLLYRRYNRSASSLDAALRAESEQMLNAIVDVREKHFGEV